MLECPFREWLGRLWRMSTAIKAQTDEGAGSACPPSQGGKDRFIVPSLFLLALVCYANTLTNGFVYDDKLQVLNNPYVKSWRYLPQIFGTTVWSFVGAAGDTNYYRPLMTFTYLVLWKMFGDLPFGYHLLNILLNALVVALVYYSGISLFRQRGIAAVAAALFAVHPVHTETVNWIAAVPDLEATLLVLTAFFLYIRRPVMNLGTRIGVAVCYAAAMMAKEPALMLAPLLVFYEHFVREGHEDRSLAQKTTQYIPVCLVGFSYLVLRSFLLGNLAPVLQHPQLTWPRAIYSSFSLLIEYAWLLVWPQRMSAFHVFHESTGPWEPRVLLGVALVLAGILFLAYFLKTQPELAYGVLWVGVTLAPVLNARWMASNVLTERYLYLPSVGFCWIVGWLAKAAWDSATRATTAKSALRCALCLGGVVVFALAVTKTLRRNRVWRDDLTLYTTTLVTDPDSYVMHLNLGSTYFEQGDQKRAEAELNRALALKPHSVNVLNALGCLYLDQGLLDQADRLFVEALALKPQWTDVHLNHGRVLEKRGRNQEALAEFRKAVETGPVSPYAHLYLAQALVSQGDDGVGELEFRKSLELGPTLVGQHGLANLLVRQGRLQEAETLLRKITAEYPFDSVSHLQLAKLLEQANKHQEALKEYQAVLQNDPRNTEALGALKRISEP